MEALLLDLLSNIDLPEAVTAILTMVVVLVVLVMWCIRWLLPLVVRLRDKGE